MHDTKQRHHKYNHCFRDHKGLMKGNSPSVGLVGFFFFSFSFSFEYYIFPLAMAWRERTKKYILDGKFMLIDVGNILDWAR